MELPEDERLPETERVELLPETERLELAEELLRTEELAEREELPTVRVAVWAELRVALLRETLAPLRETPVLREEAAVLRAGLAPRETAAERETEDTRETPELRKELLRVPDPKADADALRRRPLCRPLCSGPA